MPLAPPPTIETGLGLVIQPLIRNDMTRAAELTYALNVAGVPSAAVAQEAIDDFQGDFVTFLAARLDTAVTIGQPSIRLGDGSTTPFEAVGSAAPSVGGNGATVVPPNVALLMKKTTGLGGRNNHGRSYLPFCLDQTSVLENGTVLVATLGVFNGIATTFLADLVADGIPMVIPHKAFNVPLAPHYVTAVSTGPAVIGYGAESIVGTQRRRLGR
jgi:hypothetical protein